MRGVGNDYRPLARRVQDVIAAVVNHHVRLGALQQAVVLFREQLRGLHHAAFHVHDGDGLYLGHERRGPGGYAAPETDHQHVVRLGLKHGSQVSQHFEANLIAISQRHLGVSVQPERLAVVYLVAHQGGCASAAFAVIKNISVLGESEVLGQKYALT